MKTVLTLKFPSTRVATALIVACIAGCAARGPAPVSDSRPPVDAEASKTAAPVAVVPVPVTKPIEVAPAKPVVPLDPSKFHTVQRGDTLYSIAFQHSLDRRELAAWNNIENLNVIRVGDNLRLTPPDVATTAATATISATTLKPGEVVTAPLILTPSVGPSSAAESQSQSQPQPQPLANTAQLKIEPKAGRVPYSDQAYARLSSEIVAASAATTAVIPSIPPSTGAIPTPAKPTAATATGVDNIDWSWPISGAVANKVTGPFTVLSKGIDIPGSRGTAVMAAAPGTVIYNKSGFRGYGRLIIIKHSENWLSAYAHNEKVLVKEEEVVKKGQKIAEMGSSDTDSVKLHFEIRKNGVPVDPIKFLPK